MFRAACFRNLGQAADWRKAILSAQQKGAPPEPIRHESQLGSIQLGLVDAGSGFDLAALMATAVSPEDVTIAVVHGYLARERPDRVLVVVDTWSAEHPGTPHLHHMRGLYWCWWGETDRARAEFEQALQKEPRHELARMALAKMLEDWSWLEAALSQYAQLASQFSNNRPAHIGCARILRKLGRAEESRALLRSRRWPRDPTALAELAQVELDLGNFAEAESLFKQAHPDPIQDASALTAAATVVALRGKVLWAERLFARLDAVQRYTTESYDLRAKIASNPNDAQSVETYRRLAPPSSEPFREPPGEALDGAADRRSAAGGAEFYALHCAACHGVDGDGMGRAARHLYPRPRNLRTGSSRLVSTVNGVPTLDDIQAVIGDGMPGTSMPSFGQLSHEQRMELARETLRLRRQGIRSRFAKLLADQGEETDAENLRQLVELHTQPGQAVRVPRARTAADSGTLARGRELYVAQGCRGCHGDTGTGASELPLYDESGMPTLARDLVHDPFKGGDDAESLCKRILAGMPGSPHPSSPTLTENQLSDLVDFCVSLSREPRQTLTNHERALRSTDQPLWKAQAGQQAE